MGDMLYDVAYVLGRYFHLVFTALLVGGTLFYLWVVPAAISDLKEESQLAVFGRARWVFRYVVFLSIIVLLITGAILTARNMQDYLGKSTEFFREAAKAHNPSAESFQSLDNPGIFERRAIWFVIHVAVGLISMFIALALVYRGRPPIYPITWMKVNFALLMLVIFIGVMTRVAGRFQFENLRTEVGNSAIPKTP